MKKSKAVFGILAITLAIVGRVSASWILPLLLLTLPVTVEAQFTYAFTNNAITITGYTGPGGTVVIPSEVNGVPVTNIGDGAFENCTSLTNLTIPDSVTDIGDDAFKWCCSLTSVTIPDSVTNVGDYAFSAWYGQYYYGSWPIWNISALTSVTIGNGVTTIGYKAFESCYSLTNLTIGNSVASIGGDAFIGCTSLAGVAIPNSTISIGDSAFYACSSLASVTIGNSVASIGGGAFGSCKLTSVTIPNSVTNIGDSAFASCTSLTGAYFPANAPTVDSTVFDGDNYLTFYYLPGTTGWGPFFANRPAVLWNPQVQPGSIGVRTNQFGFNITASSNLVVVVQVSSNLTAWSGLATNTLTSGSAYFSDPQWTNYPARFYRLAVP